MAKGKTGVDGLADAISDILGEYVDEVDRKKSVVIKKVAKAGATALKQESEKNFGAGAYSKGWTSKVEEKRLETVATLHNAKKPGLVHLLEHGHLTRNGTSRTRAIVHVAPVEEMLTRDFENQLKVELS